MTKIYYSLYDRMLSPQSMREAFKKVKAAKGGPGIDGQTIRNYEENLKENSVILAQELREKRYRPLPVKRVEIEKPDGGVRKLGVPAVRDRVVQQVLKTILEPIFDPHFHPSSYGYRPKRNTTQAICKVQRFTREFGLQWVVDMDLSKCFDTLDHDLILKRFKTRIADGSIINLLRLFLESGVMIGREWEPSEVGSPQGGVISPLIANVYLDEFDQFMKERNHRIVRYADDIIILTRSESAAVNAQKQATHFLELHLKLTINRKKTHRVHCSEGIKYLGVVIYPQYTAIQDKKIDKLKVKIKQITRRNSPVNLKTVIRELNPVIRGFANYFRVANCKSILRSLMQWIRRRLRAKQMTLWKKSGKLHRRLRQLGYRGNFKSIKMSSWRNSHSPLVCMAMKNIWFDRMRLYNLEKVTTGYSVSDP